jgi:ComF family protein
MWQKIIELVQNLLAPEDIKIQKLLDLPAGTMRDLLPKSAVYSKDIFVLFDYQNKIVRLIVKSIKYKNNAGLRKRIANYLYEEIIDISSEIALFEGAPPLLVPMPMSKIEKRKRGFNQCEELVREIKKLGGNNIEVSYDTLKKVRETERQTTLSREKRAENVRECMKAENKILKNKTIIVLDDVYTTGASLTEARRALLEAGAKRVIGIFIAH